MSNEEILDSGDRDAIIELELSAGYRLVVERINEEIARLQEDLERPLEFPATNMTRGLIKGLRTALAIPGILKAEIPEEK